MSFSPEILFFLIMLFLALVAFLFFASFFILAFEEIYGHIFKRPLYVHFYWSKLRLQPEQQLILKKEFQFYNTLPENRKKAFEHRVVKFIERHEFIGRSGFLITDQVKVLIAATSTMLTFGMRKYLFEVIDKVIVYESAYVSTLSGDCHKGEFNPQLKAIVFSWEDFLQGYKIGNDNLNLGIHEFSHVLHFHGSKYDDISALNFNRMYKKIASEVKKPAVSKLLIESDYFRIYAYTNQYEFLAVIIEHYFETPDLFRRKFPDLYKSVSLMLNHKHS